MGATLANDYTNRREQLFERHVDAVYAYVAYRLGRRHEDVADITQDVFLSAFKTVPSSGETGERMTDGAIRNEKQWLIGIARNKVVDHLRKRQRERAAITGNPSVLEDTVSDSIEDRPDIRLISAVMNAILPRYAELLELKYIDGYSVRDIAQSFGETEKAIESALTRARESFRAKWQELKDSSESKYHESQR